MSFVPCGDGQAAFLLHRRDYRETSLLLDFLTRNWGRIRVLGKGTRRQKVQQSSIMWPFRPLLIGWTGKGELPVLTHVEPGGTMTLRDPRHLACALYLNELLIELLAPGDPHPELFDLYRTVLQGLATGDEPAVLLRCFEIGFLDEIGYGLVLDYEVRNGSPIKPDLYYEYHPEYGPVESAPSAATVRGRTLLGLACRQLDAATANGEAKRLMRRMISHHLGGRVLHSRKLFKFRPLT